MKKIMITFLMIVLLTGCVVKDKSFEDCVETYGENDSFCSDEELLKGFKKVIDESNLIDETTRFTSAIMLSENTVYVRGTQSDLITKEGIENWQVVLKYIKTALGDTNYEITITLSDKSNYYIFSQNNNEMIGILVIDIMDTTLSIQDKEVINMFLKTSGFTDKRIRYGHVLTGDDIFIDECKFVIKSSNYEELKYFAEELELAFSEFEVVTD